MSHKQRHHVSSGTVNTLRLSPMKVDYSQKLVSNKKTD